jgi:transposase
MQHRNAPLTPNGRRRLVALVEEEHLTFEAAAAASNVAKSTAHTWVSRWREAGEEQRRDLSCLADRSSRLIYPRLDGVRFLDVVPSHVVHPGLLEGWGCRPTQQQGGHRMKLHGNARTCPKSRRLLVDRLEGEWSLAEAAEAAGVSERTAAKWLSRWRSEGEEGLQDRSSAPHTVSGRTPETKVEAIAALRRVRMTGPEIAGALEMASSTVSAVLLRIGLGKLSRLEPPEPPNRYERARPES